MFDVTNVFTAVNVHKKILGSKWLDIERHSQHLCEVSRKTHSSRHLCPHRRCPLLLFPVNVTEQYMNGPNDTWTMLMSTLVYFWIDFLVKEVLSQQVKLSVFFPDAVSAYKLKLFQRKLVELVLHLPYVGLLQL